MYCNYKLENTQACFFDDNDYDDEKKDQNFTNEKIINFQFLNA